MLVLNLLILSSYRCLLGTKQEHENYYSYNYWPYGQCLCFLILVTFYSILFYLDCWEYYTCMSSLFSPSPPTTQFPPRPWPSPPPCLILSLGRNPLMFYCTGSLRHSKALFIPFCLHAPYKRAVDRATFIKESLADNHLFFSCIIANQSLNF